MSTGQRTKITLSTVTGGKAQVLHNGYPLRIVLTPSMLHLGCIDITPEAAHFILDKWQELFSLPTREVTIQEGGHPC